MKTFLKIMKLWHRLLLIKIGIYIFAGLAITYGNSTTNVTVANVTPGAFTIFWNAPQSIPSIFVYADTNGTTDLQGEVGIEFFPIHTGSPTAQNDYYRRTSKYSIQQRMQKNGIFAARVSNCKPNTKYYLKIVSSLTNNNQTLTYPQTGFVEVKTQKTNSFVMDAKQLIVNIPGSNLIGCVLFLSHPQSVYPIAAIVGDGCPTTNAVFNVSDLFAIAGGNFSPNGTQQFTITMLKDYESFEESYELIFTNAFSVVSSSSASFTAGYEQLILDTSSVLIRSGENGTIGLSLETTVPVTNVQIAIQFSPSTTLSNPSFSYLSELIDSANATVSQPQQGLWLVTLPAKNGLKITNSVANLATINFSTATGLPSTIVIPTIIQIQAFKLNGNLVDYNYARVGKIVILGAQPVLEAGITPANNRALIIYGAQGASYQIQRITQLNAQKQWEVETEVTLQNSSSLIVPLTIQNNQTVFYRAMEISNNRFESSTDTKEKVRVKNESKPIKVLQTLPYRIK